MWCSYVWNMFDFAADARDQGGEPGMNHKGLVTFDRKIKKDSFYLYKARWNPEPMIHICSKRYVDRPESKTTVKVYSNQSAVELYCDDRLVARKGGSYVFTFEVPITGEHRLRAVAGSLSDTATIHKVDAPNPAYKLSAKSSNSANWV
jgi:beta-galactosidase